MKLHGKLLVLAVGHDVNVRLFPHPDLVSNTGDRVSCGDRSQRQKIVPRGGQTVAHTYNHSVR
jgi:hypothetical protein